MSAQPPSAKSETAPPRPATGEVSEQPKIINHKSYIVNLLSYRTLWILALVSFIADQVTKSMIADRLPFGSYGPGGQIVIIPGLFNLVHVGNTGAAWSMFSGQSVALAVLALGTLAAMFYWRRALGLHHPAAQPAFGLLCGGIAGNLVDRLRHGHVIDFLDFHFGNYIYPTFNVADSAIFVGVFWYIIWSLKQPAEKKPEN